METDTKTLKISYVVSIFIAVLVEMAISMFLFLGRIDHGPPPYEAKLERFLLYGLILLGPLSAVVSIRSLMWGGITLAIMPILLIIALS